MPALVGEVPLARQYVPWGGSTTANCFTSCQRVWLRTDSAGLKKWLAVNVTESVSLICSSTLS